MKKFFLMMIFVATGFLAACNTTKGVGRDVQATGEAIEEAAEKTSEEIDENF